jgi:hypothetical protein
LGALASRFITDGGQTYGTITSGSAFQLQSAPGNDPAAEGCRRFKLITLDISMHIEGERALWVLWQGDENVASTLFNNPDAVRSSSEQAVPLAGGVLGPSQSYIRNFHFKNRWISSTQKIVLCIDPTAGVGQKACSIFGMYLMAD